MKKLNALCLKILQFFENRSILFYIFWLSFFIGEGTHQILLKVWGCSVFLNEHKVMGYASKIIACDPIETGFVFICIFLCLLSIFTYFFWYVFKCLRYIFRLGFKR